MPFPHPFRINRRARRARAVRWLSALACACAGFSAHAQDVTLLAAGSLRAALTEVVARLAQSGPGAVRTRFGPSGLLREEIEGGATADVFASADMGQVLRLRDAGRAAQVAVFARNRLCAFAPPQVRLTRQNFAARLLEPTIAIGTSTPKADPGGDYTWEMFRLIDRGHPGAYATLNAKARQLVGGVVAPDPGNPDPIGAALASGQIQVAIGYCSGSAARLKANPGVDVVPVPDDVAPSPQYGLALLSPGNARAAALALSILSVEGQAVLARHGFVPVGALDAPPRAP